MPADRHIQTVRLARLLWLGYVIDENAASGLGFVSLGLTDMGAYCRSLRKKSRRYAGYRKNTDTTGGD